MTILHRETFNSFLPANFDGVFEWDFLCPVFEGTNIKPMDIDCIVERKGKFLVFETKSPGKEIPLGQTITLESLVKTGYFVIIILWAKKPEEINSWQVWFKKGDGIIKKTIEGNSNDLREYIKEKWWHGLLKEKRLQKDINKPNVVDNAPDVSEIWKGE